MSSSVVDPLHLSVRRLIKKSIDINQQIADEFTRIGNDNPEVMPWGLCGFAYNEFIQTAEASIWNAKISNESIVDEDGLTIVFRSWIRGMCDIETRQMVGIPFVELSFAYNKVPTLFNALEPSALHYLQDTMLQINREIVSTLGVFIWAPLAYARDNGWLISNIAVDSKKNKYVIQFWSPDRMGHLLMAIDYSVLVDDEPLITYVNKETTK